ncbi:MAG: YrdB family protein [Chloroflexi bacterium]|nr:YrdB family protein [Chloroflexota bacterium]
MAARQPPPAVGPNDVLRFGLEIAALVALGYGGWIVGGGGVTGTGLAVALTAVPAAVWGVFRVDGDPRPAPIPVPGVVRLTIEALFFGSAVAALLLVGENRLGGVLTALVVAHYAWGHRRVRWLIRHPGRLPGRDRFPGGP